MNGPRRSTGKPRRWPLRGQATSRHSTSGTGSVRLVFDAGDELYRWQCHWFGGPVEAHLLEHARGLTESDEGTWGSDRSPRVRVRLPDHCSSWAGPAPDPGALAGTWVLKHSPHDPGAGGSRLAQAPVPGGPQDRHPGLGVMAA